MQRSTGGGWAGGLFHAALVKKEHVLGVQSKAEVFGQFHGITVSGKVSHRGDRLNGELVNEHLLSTYLQCAFNPSTICLWD